MPTLLVAPPRGRIPVRRPLIRSSYRRGLSRRATPREVIGAVVLALVLMSGIGALPKEDAAAPPTATTALAAPTPFAGGPAGCVAPDPTTTGCLTSATAHALSEIDRVFGGYRKGPKILSVGCWDAHAWNPTSDHPKGRACDLFFSKAGTFAAGAELDHGWELANWLRANAGALRVRYVIWQARIWQADTNRDSGGWGTKYSGGGIYDMRSATGSHSDHVHVSFAA